MNRRHSSHGPNGRVNGIVGILQFYLQTELLFYTTKSYYCSAQYLNYRNTNEIKWTLT